MPPLDLIVPPGRHAARPGVRIHRIDLGRQDVTRFEGLRTTTPAVTIVHLARALPQLPLERVVQEAFAKRLASTRQLEQALDRHRGGRGTRRLRRMLELGVDDLRSKAERSLRHSLRAASLPSPQFNAQLGPWKIDALWPDHRLAVEINGYAAHSSPWSHDRDHRKEQWLRGAGLDLRRFTALQAIDEPALVEGLVPLRQLLPVLRGQRDGRAGRDLPQALPLLSGQRHGDLRDHEHGLVDRLQRGEAAGRQALGEQELLLPVIAVVRPG